MNISGTHMIVFKYFILISIVVATLHYFLQYLIKVIQVKIAEYKGNDPNDPTLSENSSLEDQIKFHVDEVKQLAQKIADEKKELELFFTFENMDGVVQQCSELRNEMIRDLEIENLQNKSRFEEMENKLLALQNEINGYKTELDSDLKKALTPNDAKSCKILAEVAIQTEESYDAIYDEKIDSGLPDEVLLALKCCVINLAKESDREWASDILKSLEGLGEKYQIIKSMIMSYWDEISKEITTCGTILDKIQTVEQTVFGILIFLQQQSYEAQTIRETLKFFDHKFSKFVNINQSRWNTSCLKLDKTFSLVKKYESIITEDTSGFAETSGIVSQQLSNLELLLKRFTGTAKLICNTERLTRTIDKDIAGLVKKIGDMSSKLDNDFCRKLNRLSEALLDPGEKLYHLYTSTEGLQTYANYVKNMPAKSSKPFSKLSSPSPLPTIQEIEEDRSEIDDLVEQDL